MVTKARMELRAQPVPTEPTVLMELLVTQDLKELLGNPEPPEEMASLVPQGLLVWLVLLEHRAKMAGMEETEKTVDLELPV